jgi:Zn-dependent alcohol dehydrogenase
MGIKSRAAIFEAYGKPLVVDEVDYGDPDADQVVVKLFASGICHSQLHQINNSASPAPQLLGHEATGVVVQAGSKVSRVKEGDRVMVTWLPGAASKQLGTPSIGGATWRGQDVPSGNVYTWAEHCRVHEQYVVPMASGVDVNVTAIIGCAVMTGCGAVTNTANVKAGETVAIFGAGGVGLCAVQAAKNVGAGKVIVVDLDDKKLEFAKQFGGTHFVNATKGDAVEQVRELSNGGVDYAFDTIGVPITIQQILLATRMGVWAVEPGGTSVLVGVPVLNAELDFMHMLLGEKIYKASLGGSVPPDQDFDKYVDWYKSGKLPLDKLVTKRYTIEQINEACEALEHGQIAGRSIMVYAEP